MTKEPEYNAHARCGYCHALRPVKETITFNGVNLCRDTDCLQLMKGHVNASFLSGYSSSLIRGTGE